MSFVRNARRGRHAAAAPAARVTSAQSRLRPAGASRGARELKKTLTMAFAFVASAGFVAVNAVDPSGAMAAADMAEQQAQHSSANVQSVTTTDGYAVAANGENYVAESRKALPAFSGLPHIIPDPGSAQAIARDMVLARGWDESEFACLYSLWKRESGWRVNALNQSSGAYGIPQALPGEKMAVVGADWQTNPATQITWGLNYIQARYGSPCGAWSASESKGWY